MRQSRPLLLGSLAIATAVVLTGCLDAGFPGPTPTAPTATDAPSATSTPATPTPTVTPAPTPTPTAQAGTPVRLDCAQLLTVDALYSIDPNLTLVPLSGQPSTRFAAEAIEADGTACQVSHATSGASAFLGISAPGSEALERLRAAAGPEFPLDGAEAYGQATQFQVFHDERRVSGECDPNFNPDSLAALVQTALAAGA